VSAPRGNPWYSPWTIAIVVPGVAVVGVLAAWALGAFGAANQLHVVATGWALIATVLVGSLGGFRFRAMDAARRRSRLPRDADAAAHREANRTLQATQFAFVGVLLIVPIVFGFDAPVYVLLGLVAAIPVTFTALGLVGLIGGFNKS
jgi:hypothetical protein